MRIQRYTVKSKIVAEYCLAWFNPEKHHSLGFDLEDQEYTGMYRV